MLLLFPTLSAPSQGFEPMGQAAVLMEITALSHQMKVGVKGLETYLRERRDSGRGEGQGHSSAAAARAGRKEARKSSGHTRGYQGL